MKYCRIIFCCVGLFFCKSAVANTGDSLDIIRAANEFVTAFNNFNWQQFRNSFTDDATIFYPVWEKAKRVSGRKEIEAAWTGLFPEFLDPQNKEKLSISPKHIQVQQYGKTAILSFHLGNGETLVARRTLVMVKQKKSWKIAHLHASILEKDPG
jgi:ketosteroid isomerase-like protein